MSIDFFILDFYPVNVSSITFVDHVSPMFTGETCLKPTWRQLGEIFFFTNMN